MCIVQIPTSTVGTQDPSIAVITVIQLYPYSCYPEEGIVRMGAEGAEEKAEELAAELTDARHSAEEAATQQAATQQETPDTPETPEAPLTQAQRLVGDICARSHTLRPAEEEAR